MDLGSIPSKGSYGLVAQLARALPWHGRGQGFESPQVHHFEFVKEVASGLRPSALVSAKKFQGVLNSTKRIPAESRRFPNKVWIVPKAQEPMNRAFKIVGVMQNLLSI